MPAPENNRDILKINSCPHWITHSSNPAAGTINLDDLVGVTDMETVIQMDIRCVGDAMSYASVGGGTAISLIDSEWAYIPLFNGTKLLDLIVTGGTVEIILWGAKNKQ